MSTIDRAALIEAVACRIHQIDCNCPNDFHSGHTADYTSMVGYALPVIASAVLKPLRGSHGERMTKETLPNGTSIKWHACACGFRTYTACPTVRLLGQIEAELKESS